MKAATGPRTPPAAAPTGAVVAARPAPRGAVSSEDLSRFRDICRRLADHATGGRKTAGAVWRAFVDAAMQLVGSTRGIVYLLDPSEDTYRAVCARGLTPHQDTAVTAHRFARGGTVLLAQMEATRRPVVATAAEGVFSPVTRAFGVRSLLLAPLTGGRGCAGFFVTDGGDIALEFPPALRDAVAECGAHLALALEVAALRRAHTRGMLEVQLERALARSFAEASTIEELARDVGEGIRQLLGADDVQVTWHLSESRAGRRGMACLCRHEGGAAPQLCVPFSAHGRPAGVLHLSGDLPRRGAQTRLRLAQQAASRASAVAQRLRQLAELERLATRDPLTGLINRREFVQRLDGELARARREGVPLTVMYLDLDDLKGLNDRVGHPTADVALCELADRITARARASDVVARLGGDEFALILPHTAARGGLVLFTTLLEALRDVRVDGSAGVLSMSGGLATYPDNARDADALLRAADAALYAAKRRGKGAACLADDASV